MTTTNLRRDTMRIPAATLGHTSPLPLLRDNGVHVAEPTANFTYGQPFSLLPYAAQDGYDRRLVETGIDVIVLENEHLTATFLPGYGGRLWSLVHRPSGRELLFRNPILQPANLALRDAWLAGGVEWNLGATGHWPLTCAPVHAGEVSTPDGPVLRMWEYERMRRIVWRVDAWLPAGSPVLYTHVRLHNPHPQPVPVYWWSNIAVPEHDDVRVIAPADSAYHFDYDARIHTVPFPYWEGLDRSYTTRAPGAADYFFQLARDERPWITALDRDGRGLAQASTARLSGRKLFLWGGGTGGKRWQEWLSGPGGRYLEIQAGLADTQLEHLPLPSRVTWAWTEAYGLAEADPERVHGPWPIARCAAEAAIERLIPAARLEAAHRQAETFADQPPALWHPASGWGAIETKAGGVPAYPGTPFPHPEDSALERVWLSLVDTGSLPVSDPPAPAVTGPHWRSLLNGANDWHSLLHLGQIDYADGDTDSARIAWKASHAAKPNPWALRNLAEAARIGGNHVEAAEYLRQAHAMRTDVVALTVELLDALLAAGHPAEALTVIDRMPPPQRALGRVRLHEARAAVAAGDLPRAAAILQSRLVVDNLREGEDSMSTLWAEYQRATGGDTPLPYEYDFRMHS